MRHPIGRAALALGLGEPIAVGATVDMQDTVNTCEQGFGICLTQSTQQECRARRLLNLRRKA